MQVTNLRFMPANPWDKQVLTYITLEFDHCFVIKDIKLIRIHEKIFLSFPEKLINFTCSSCRKRNPVTANYCMNCGIQLKTEPQPFDKNNYSQLAHPVTPRYRHYLQELVLTEYEKWNEERNEKLTIIEPLPISNEPLATQPL